MTSERKPALVWVDIEATGLNAKQDVMMELGLRVTDWWGTEMARYTSVVWDYRYRARLAANEVVFKMHLNSGLLAEVDAVNNLASPNHRNQFLASSVAERAVKYLNLMAGGLGPYDGLFPMSGNSVHYDRAFLMEHMPVLGEWFHYRNHDISSIREECRVSNPGLHAKEVELPKVHRPQQDIDNSIALRQHFLKNFLWVGEEYAFPPE